MTFETWLVQATRQAVLERNQRFGQYLDNYLYITRPDLSERAHAAGFDPFYCTAYNDPKVGAFLQFVAENW